MAADSAPPIRIAVDLMGGDHGPAVTLPACRAFLDAHPAAEIVIVGSADAIAQAAGWPRCTRIAASEVIEMTDSVETALRRKKDSSLRVAVSQVKPHPDRPSLAQACVSAGNTGALMAVSRYVLKTVDGIDRPAIATLLPNEHDGFTTVLDLGANVDCTAEHLLQFAVMGSALVAAIFGKEEPTVGLLNIGEEAIKGSEAIKAAGELLREAAAAGMVNFHGNVEANDIFKGTTDIVVCDGFVGNVMLKTAEGLASMLTTFIKQEFTRNPLTKLAALAALPVLSRFKRRVDPRRYNGAALLGLRGLVFKSHGSADAFAFQHALDSAHDAARNGLLDRVQARIRATLAAVPAAAHPTDSAAFDDSGAYGGAQSA
ncbi:MAG TPA: phosphate acyltransferase PlsX [Caldimonas sp.]